MTPCSVWCRPDEGIHVSLDWTWRDLEDPERGLEALREKYVGRIGTSLGETCLAAGTRTRYLGADRAEVAPRSEGWFRNPILLTVQVVNQ